MEEPEGGGAVGPSAGGGGDTPRARPARRPAPRFAGILPNETIPAETVEIHWQRPRRRARPAVARRQERTVVTTTVVEPLEIHGWPMPAMGFGTLICSIVVCVVAIKYLETLPKDSERKIFTKEELAHFDGTHGKPIYLALIGKVFDVSEGRRYYGKGGGYQIFAGRDATRAFSSGDFEKDLTDDLTGFTPDQFKGLLEWGTFYHKDYKYMGKVEGRFYNRLGEPLEDLQRVEEGAAEGNRLADLRKQERAMYPNCNTRWSPVNGGEVWCKAGYYPRRVREPSPDLTPKMRCACFMQKRYSELRQLYDGCRSDASSCVATPSRNGVKRSKAGSGPKQGGESSRV